MDSKRTPRKVCSPYVKVKNLLSSSYVDNLIGRDEEYNKIFSIMKNSLDKKCSSTFYISGPAGTGKSLTLNTAINNLSKDHSFNFINLNCMGFQSSASFYEQILSQFEPSPKKLRKNSSNRPQGDYSNVKNVISQSKNMTILLLDEIDQLKSKNHEILTKLFKLPFVCTDKVVLVGIANALDFTAKMTWLKDFDKKSFFEIRFLPYNKEQISQIIEYRLKSTVDNENILIQKSAIDFCARKISSCSGDIRKALDVCRRAIDLLENNAHSSNEKVCLTPLKSSDFQQNVLVKKSIANNFVDIKLMMKVLNKVYGNAIDKMDENNKVCLPSDQQVILCTLLVLLKCKSIREVKLQECREVLANICSKRGISSEGKSESDILNMCQLLADYGYVSVKRDAPAAFGRSPFSKTPKKKNSVLLSLQIDPLEAEQLLSTFHKSILSSASTFI